MPVYQVDVEKLYEGEYWSNRYFVERETIAAASVAAEDIAQIERSFHNVNVLFTKVRTSTVALGDDAYIISPLAVNGQFASGDALLPLFNVLRGDFPKFGGGRPYRKLYRGVLTEDVVIGNVISSGTLTTALNAAQSSFREVPLTTGLGEELGNVTWFAPVAMRQLRRGSRRRLLPILP
jgi:hypothetical protein